MAVDPARVAVTTGSSGGFIMAFLALFDPGARVAIQNPGYPAYRNIFGALGLEAVDLPVDSVQRLRDHGGGGGESRRGAAISTACC